MGGTPSFLYHRRKDFKQEMVSPQSKPLHVEAPGTVVNVICEKLQRKQVTRVVVFNKRDWWCADAGVPIRHNGAQIRMIERYSKPPEDPMFNALVWMMTQGKTPDDIKHLVDQAAEYHREHYG